ncbi:MAG: secretin N-terminal domain-containing protein [Candidatus Rifleibacteriota bacterium]
MSLKSATLLVLLLICLPVMASQPVDLDVKDADLRQTLQKIARQASINLIVSPKVSGKITCLVNQMDARELIFFLARANGLVVEVRGKIIIVMPGKSESGQKRVEVISLQYADSAEVAKMIQTLKQDKSVTVTHDERTNRLILVYDD